MLIESSEVDVILRQLYLFTILRVWDCHRHFNCNFKVISCNRQGNHGMTGYSERWSSRLTFWHKHFILILKHLLHLHGALCTSWHSVEPTAMVADLVGGARSPKSPYDDDLGTVDVVLVGRGLLLVVERDLDGGGRLAVLYQAWNASARKWSNKLTARGGIRILLRPPVFTIYLTRIQVLQNSHAGLKLFQD